VLLNDEDSTLQQLNKLCGDENIFSYTRLPRRRMPVEVASAGIGPSFEAKGENTGMNRENSIRLKILSHFIKGKVSMTPMEIVLMISGELEHLENIVKVVAERRRMQKLRTIRCLWFQQLQRLDESASTKRIGVRHSTCRWK
jgi:hypothetical protein